MNPKPIGFDDEEMAALVAAAAAPRPRDRPAFVELVMAELQQHPGEIGAGGIYRIGRRLQHLFTRNISDAAAE